MAPAWLRRELRGLRAAVRSIYTGAIRRKIKHSLSHFLLLGLSVNIASIVSYGFFPGSHSGRKLEFASQRTGDSIDLIESVMCAKSMVLTSSDGR